MERGGVHKKTLKGWGGWERRNVKSKRKGVGYWVNELEERDCNER